MTKFRYSVRRVVGGWWAVFDRNHEIKRFQDQGDAHRYAQQCLFDDRQV